MKLNKISNSKLIDHIYNIAGSKVREEVKDFTNVNLWKKTIEELPTPVAMTYRIAVLNMQVINGGFIQYFDNGYGIFALETVEDLKAINANRTSQLLKDCLDIINPDNYHGKHFVRYVSQRKYDNNYDKICDQLDRLDNHYYDQESHEDLEELLATYLRNNIRDINLIQDSR